MNPDRVAHGNLHPSARTVRNSFVTAFDWQWIVGDFRNRYEISRGEWAGKTGPHVTSVTNHGDVIVISDFLGFGAANHEVMERVVDRFRDELRLLARGVAAERIGHRTRLIDQKNDTRRVCAGD